jgi:hypothetical protein
MSRTIRGLLLFLCATMATACLATPIRRSAFVPRPTMPANHGAPIGEAGMKAFGQVNTLRLTPTGEISNIEDLLGQIPFEGAAGLWIPKVQFGAGVYGAPSDIISVGAQAEYTRLEWAERNVLGVLEFPENEQNQHIIMGGPGVRVNVPVGKNEEGRQIVTPAAILEANLATVPQAVYVRTGNVMVNPDGTIDNEGYTFERIDRETFILPSLAAHVTVSPIEYLHILGMVGVQRGVKNIGFDPDISRLEESTLSGYFYGFAGGGLEGRYDMFYATAVLNGAFGQPEEIGFGLSGTFSVGLVFH